MLHRRSQIGSAIFEVPTVSEQHPRNAGRDEVLLRRNVVRRHQKCGVVRVDDRGVGRKLDTGLLRRINDRFMFRDTQAQAGGGDQEHVGGSRKCRVEGGRLTVVSFADLHALRTRSVALSGLRTAATIWSGVILVRRLLQRAGQADLLRL